MSHNFKKIVDFRRLRKPKKELERIDWKIVKRFIVALHNNVRMKKSQLTTACSMGYDKGKLYIDWLELMELIKKEISEEGYEELTLTDKGHSLYRTKFDTDNFHKNSNRLLEDF